MANPIAWSFSRLSLYRQCPYKFFRIHMLPKEDPEKVDPYAGPRSEAMVEGDKMHEAFEHAIKYGAALPARYAKHSRKVENIRHYANAGERVVAEHQLAITPDLKSTGWFGKTVWARAQADVFVQNVRGSLPVDILMIDWKSGKPRSEWADQAAACAAVAFCVHKDAQTVRFDVDYVNHLDEPKTITFERSALRTVFGPILKTVAAIQHSDTTGEWPMKPSGLCPWCPVEDCPNHPGG